MSKYYYDIEQNTETWDLLRLGKFTASKAADLLMSPEKMGYKNLIRKISTERITGIPVDNYSNSWMQRGHDLENDAIKDYEYETFNKTHLVGFVELNKETGCSPDALIGKDGLLQVKCLGYKAHCECHEKGKFSSVYVKQCQFELMTMPERKYNILRTYYPGLRAFQVVLERDELLIKEIENKLEIAKKDVKRMMIKLKNY